MGKLSKDLINGWSKDLKAIFEDMYTPIMPPPIVFYADDDIIVGDLIIPKKVEEALKHGSDNP